MTNLQVVQEVCRWYGIQNYEEHIEFVQNRMGQDTRYSMDSSKLLTTGFELTYGGKGLKKFQ